jgi:DNA-binding CsgD family transcriptional regulator
MNVPAQARPWRAQSTALPTGEGLLVVTPARLILSANAAAEDVVGTADALVAVDGKLVALRPQDDRRLQEAVDTLLGGRATRSGAAFVGLSLARRSGRADYLLLMARSGCRGGPGRRLDGAEPEPHIVVVIRDFDARPALPMQLLQQCFGLTAAEARLGARLAGGCSPEQAASAFGVSLTTIRAHLRSIYRKTGTTGQVQFAQRTAAVWTATSVAAATAVWSAAVPVPDSFNRTRRRTSQTDAGRIAGAAMAPRLSQ